MKQVSLIRIVVASPSDVQHERNTLSRVAEELNRTIGRAYDLRIEVNRWETDAHPGFHVNGPQALIDPILKIEESDVFVGIFWKRFGTPVIGAGSGTQHEFNKAYSAWKDHGAPHIMFYFNGQEHAPSSNEEKSQWEEVLAFQRNFPSEGLWWSYNDVLEFERFVREHLTMFILETVKNGEEEDDEGEEEDADDEDDTLYDEKFDLERNLHVPFVCDLDGDERINIDLRSDVELDIMIFDEGDYKNWLRTGRVESSYGLYEERDQFHGFFTAPEGGSYLVVISNPNRSEAEVELTITRVDN